LLDLNGQAVSGLHLSQSPDDPRLLVVDLPPLTQGVFSLNWRALSAADGHSSQGLLVFGVRQTPGDSLAAAVNGPDPFQTAARALVDVAICGLFGTLLVLRLLLSSRSSSEAYPAFRRRAAIWAVGMAVLGVVASLIQWLSQAAASGSGGPFDWPAAAELLWTTQWGQLWLLRQALLLVAAALIFVRRRALPGPSWWAALALSLGVLLSYVFTTHAASLSAPFLPLLAGFLHLSAAGLWIGGLVALVVIILPILAREPGAREGFQAVWSGFGRYALVAVGFTLATGLFNALGLVASPMALLSNPYGRSLLLKTGTVMAVGMLGIGNSLALHPALSARLAHFLRRPAGWSPFSARRLPLTIALEATLGLVIFLLAGLLASTPPANGPDERYAGLTQPDSLTQTVDDLVITLAVRPNHPGQNITDVRVNSNRRPAPAEIMRVILRTTYLGEALGTQNADAALVEPGLYRLGASPFSLPGPWQVEVVVRRKGIPDTTARFTWNVLP
jgi:copper transport protein